MKKYTTIDDVLSYEVVPALGEYVDGFDAEAIAREAFEYVDGAFVQREDVDFWEIAEKHDITKADINIEFSAFRGECDVNGISGLLNDCMGAEEIAEAITSNLAKDFDEEAMKGIAAEAIEKMGVDVDGDEAAEQIHICLMAGKMAALGA